MLHAHVVCKFRWVVEARVGQMYLRICKFLDLFVRPGKSTEYECSLVINDFIVLQCDVQVKAHNAEGATVGCAQGADSPGISVFENDIIFVMTEPLRETPSNIPNKRALTWFMTVGPPIDLLRGPVR